MELQTEQHVNDVPLQATLAERVPLQGTSLQVMQQIADRYASMSAARLPTELFVRLMTTARDAYFDRVFEDGKDAGIIFLTSILPGYVGTLNVAFWDEKLSKERRAVVKEAVGQYFRDFDLIRMSALTPYSNQPMRTMLKKTGFVYEGTIRRGWIGPPLDDAFIFGMLREEVP
jgi:hypothetical protein